MTESIEPTVAWPIKAALLTCVVVCICVPADFVLLSSLWRNLALSLLLLGILLGIYVAVVCRSVVLRSVVFGCLSLCAVNQIANLNPNVFVVFAAPILIGVSAGFVVNRYRSVLFGLAVLNVLGLLAEWVVGRHFVSSFFGDLRFAPAEGLEFRARGLIGQPVPAAFLAVALCFALLILVRGRGRSVQLAVLAVALTSIALLTTGTRSAVLLSVVLLAAGMFVALIRGKIIPNPNLVLVLIACGSIGIVSYQWIWGMLSQYRIVDFGGLTGSVSLDNRLYAATVLEDWWANCSGVCPVIGSGMGSLFVYLKSGYAAYGISTVDNVLVRVIWEFGAVGVASLAACLAFAAVALLGRQSSCIGRAGGALVIAIVTSGFFYDSIFLRATLVLFALGLGMIARDRATPHVTVLETKERVAIQ